MKKNPVAIAIGLFVAYVLVGFVAYKISYYQTVLKMTPKPTPTPACFEVPACMVR